MTEFRTILKRALREGDCLALVLSKRRSAANAAGADAAVVPDRRLPDKLPVRPVTVGNRAAYQFLWRTDGKETHENLEPPEAFDRIVTLFGAAYAHCHLYTSGGDYSARIARDGRIRCRKSPATKTGGPAGHNRAKNYLIPDGEPCPFLIEIGVMTPAGRVRSARQPKFRQINRFLEFVEDIYERLPGDGTIHVVDFGCGKSYLTFALHHLLAEIHGRDVRITGLDRNPEVIGKCADVAERLGCEGLEFRVGDIAGHKVETRVDLAVSLHACDTATDDALARAMRWETGVILAVPCCQHELAGKIGSPELNGLLEHGILRERFAALATDALRAAALEICGYRTVVAEFIDMEHTAKNILLRAVKPSAPETPSLRGTTPREDQVPAYQRLKQALGLETIYLEEALGADFATRAESDEG